MILLALFTGFAVSLVIATFWKTWGPAGTRKRNQKLKERIYQGAAAREAEQSLAHFEKKFYLSEVETFNRFLSRYPFAKQLDEHLKRARWPISVSLFLLTSLALGALTFLLLHSRMATWSAFLISTLMTALPFLYLRWQNQRYLAKFSEYLPNALSVISNSIRVGHGLEASMEAVARTVPYPVSEEFQAVRAEVKLGQPLQAALQNLFRRIRTAETKIFVTGVAIHEELGGNLSEVLTNLEVTIRERFALQREIRVMSAQGKMTMWILLGVPFVIASVWIFNDPDTFRGFLATEMGRMAVGLAAFLQMVAFLWMRQIVRLKD